MNSVKDIDIKNRAHYFLNDMINVKIFDTNEINIDQKPYKNILICYIEYVTTNGNKLFYLINHKINQYIDESDRNKYLTPVPADESKDTLKKVFLDLIRSITRNIDNYDDEHIKIKLIQMTIYLLKNTKIL